MIAVGEQVEDAPDFWAINRINLNQASPVDSDIAISFVEVRFDSTYTVMVCCFDERRASDGRS